MMNISILHLSDLHIIDKNGTYSEVLSHLIDDIKEQCENLKHIILVITGDIIDKAKFSHETKQIALKFFKDLHDAIGDKIVGVEISPGNHDKSHDTINTKLIEEKINSHTTANIDQDTWEYFLVPYKNYIFLVNEIRKIFNRNSKKINNSYYVESIDEKNFKIIFINMDTSWSSRGGNIDKRNICIDERQLSELKEMYQHEKQITSKRYITVMTAHHPLNWMKEKDEAFLSPWLLNSEYFNIDFYLCGHTHDRQIKSFFDTYKSYITLVTGIGWDEKTPDEEKDKHRYSIYNIDLQNNYCEIIIRKTLSNGHFYYDTDVLLSEEEKTDKKIYLSLTPFAINPKIQVPICVNGSLQNRYLFINRENLMYFQKISHVFYNVAYHMSLFQSLHIKDFFIKYELNKSSKTTVQKQEAYDNYFYKGMGSPEVNNLFASIKNDAIIYDNFISYLRELSGTLVNELKDTFNIIKHIRLHFRKYYKTKTEQVLYVAFCQAIAHNNVLPPIRDIEYKNSMIEAAFTNNSPLVYSHNKSLNPLPILNTSYEDFITIAPKSTKNIYQYKHNRKDILRPFLTASLSVTCNSKNNLLDFLNYMDIGGFIFKLVYDYIDLFKIELEKLINNNIEEK